MFLRAPVFFKKTPKYVPALAGGNTPLHISVAQYNHQNEINKLIKDVGNEAAATMAKTINDRGQLPVDLLAYRYTLQLEKKQAAFSLLRPLMLMNDIRPLSEPINVDAILKRYYSPHDDVLLCHLKLACSIANKTRATLKESATHPQPHHSEDKQIELLLKTEEMREKYPTITSLQDLEKLAYTASQYGVGNCAEFTYLALYNLIKQKREKSFAIIYEIFRGDHSVLYFDDVVCDAWAGDAYPVTEINSRLKTYRRIEDYNDELIFINVPTSFNPNYHKLQYYLSVGEKPNNLTFFDRTTRNEPTEISEPSVKPKI